MKAKVKSTGEIVDVKLDKLSKLDYINFIELTDNYLEDIKKVFKKL